MMKEKLLVKYELNKQSQHIVNLYLQTDKKPVSQKNINVNIFYKNEDFHIDLWNAISMFINAARSS